MYKNQLFTRRTGGRQSKNPRAPARGLLGKKHLIAFTPWSQPTFQRNVGSEGRASHLLSNHDFCSI